MTTWVKAHEFATRFEAEMARARLESADVPVMITAHEAGIFGPGFQGVVPRGVQLLVPSDLVAEVQALLDFDGDAPACREVLAARRPML
jgi:hypothetical protein